MKIAPEAIGEGPLSKMMKPGVGAYYRFKELFDKYSKEAGKEQYLIPYFIAAHPGTRDQDMLDLALWLKKNGFRADQVQAFLPSPMATATAMYHSGQESLETRLAQQRGGHHPEGDQGAPAAQGVPAVSRLGQLAGAARGLEAHGARRLDRQRQASLDPGLSAGGLERPSRGRATRRRGGTSGRSAVRGERGGADCRRSRPMRAAVPRARRAAAPRAGGAAARATGTPRAPVAFRTQHTGLPKSGKVSPALKRRGRP